MIYRNPGFYFVEEDPYKDKVTIVSDLGFLWKIRDYIFNFPYYRCTFQLDILFDEKGVPHLTCYTNCPNSELEEYEILFFSSNASFPRIKNKLDFLLGYRLTVQHKYIKETITKIIYGIRSEKMG